MIYIRYNTKIELLIVFLILSINSIHSEKSPHGEKQKIDCTVCHTTTEWKTIKEGSFNHSTTKFPLVGIHKSVSCKNCHKTLIFPDAKAECISCHTDVHEGTLGKNCQQCHTPNSWIVKNLREIHMERGFLLVGAHASSDCAQCHKSASKLRFENINTECVSCHHNNYLGTIGGQVDHVSLRFDTDCARCHSQRGSGWSQTGKGFDHGFFPLRGGHSLTESKFGSPECYKCHTTKEFSTAISSDCGSCHSVLANNPNPGHLGQWKKFDCKVCHSIQSWTPNIKFKEHDGWFKIYSGEHRGKWEKCSNCHNTPSKTSCSLCHDFDSRNNIRRKD